MEDSLLKPQAGDEAMSQSKEQIDAAHEAHEREQTLWLAENTTPEYRFNWLRRSLRTFREAHIQEIKQRAEAELAKWNGQ